MNKIVSASILSADLCNLERDIKRAENAGCGYIHFDVMDGIFVNNISYGIPVLKSVSRVAEAVLDVHLMITEPIRYVDAFAQSGADIITFHTEATDYPQKVIDKIHACGKKAGIAIKPNTPVETLQEFFGSADMLLIMTVEPGFGGQGFIEKSVERLYELQGLLEKNGRQIPIQVDGGINDLTAKDCVKAGASILVAGSYLFKAENMKKSVELLLNA